jgi:hypothetical protein
MSRSPPNVFYSFRHVIIGGLLVAFAGALAPAHAYDDYRDARWRAHQQHEREVRAREARERARWDHQYWDRYQDERVYYAPPPPPPVGFIFRFGR